MFIIPRTQNKERQFALISCHTLSMRSQPFSRTIAKLALRRTRAKNTKESSLDPVLNKFLKLSLWIMLNVPSYHSV